MINALKFGVWITLLTVIVLGGISGYILIVISLITVNFLWGLGGVILIFITAFLGHLSHTFYSTLGGFK